MATTCLPSESAAKYLCIIQQAHCTLPALKKKMVHFLMQLGK